VLAQLLKLVINALHDGQCCEVLSMDAYHHYNSYLDSHTIPEGQPNAGAPLRSIKGFPITIDARSFAADLAKVKYARGDEQVRLPMYDRTRHDPRPDAVCIMPRHQIVLVEGLFLLRGGGGGSSSGDTDDNALLPGDNSVQNDSGWDSVRQTMDFTVLLQLPIDESRRRVVERKMASGRTREAAEQHFDKVDAPTIQGIEELERRRREESIRTGSDEGLETLGADLVLDLAPATANAHYSGGIELSAHAATREDTGEVSAHVSYSAGNSGGWHARLPAAACAGLVVTAARASSLVPALASRG
jgi:pantothenate kinase